MKFSKLIRECQSLKAKIDVLEAEIEYLQSSIEQSHRHGVADDAQYSQIVEMSSRLQTQATSDVQQWGSEKKRWVKDRVDMQQTSTGLKSEVRVLRETCRGLSEPGQVQCKGVATEAEGVFNDYVRTDSLNGVEAKLRIL